MQSILNHKAVRIAGAVDFSRTPEGITPRRLPKWASGQIMDPTFQLMSSCASGVRISFATNSDVVELDVLTTGLEFPGQALPAPCFDLVIDDDIVGLRSSTRGNRIMAAVKPDRTFDSEFVEGPSETITFDGLGTSMKRVEIWLPQNQMVELRSLRIADRAAVKAVKPRQRTWVHYGSSISQCAEAGRPTSIWPAVAARRAGVELTNLGFGGQCHLDQLVARTIRDRPADAISAKIGINIVNGDTFRERTFVAALHGFLDTVRDGHKKTPLLVVTPILFPAGEDHPGPTMQVNGRVGVIERPLELSGGALSIGRIRELTEFIVTKRQRDGDENLDLLDGRQLFGEGDLNELPDGLHPNTEGYRRMGERFEKLVFGEGGPFAN